MSLKKVSSLYENVTQELVRLKFADGRDDLITTPGHAFLDETGSFTKIGDLVRLGGGQARVIDQSGEVLTVAGETLEYSAATADMFEQASVKKMTVGGNQAYKEEVQTGWKTYNFEVEGLHTYIAGGVRVHNDSGWLGELGNAIDDGLDSVAQSFFGAEHDGAFDSFTDYLTKPLHWAGTALNGTLSILSDIGSRLTGGGGTREYNGPNGRDFVIVNGGNDDNPNNDYFVDPHTGQIYDRTPDILDRTPRQEQAARQNAENLRNLWDGFKEWIGGDDEASGSSGHSGSSSDGGGRSGGGGRNRGNADDSNNITNYLGDRDGDGVPNIVDFNDGVGWADQSKPIIFDLTGAGINITELSNSSTYVDATGDGLLNRTAWAGEGNAVLFYDPDNLGAIVEKRQYVFTEWDPTATSDMEALASAFDSNGDGVFDALDDAWLDFKLLVTNADGSTTAMTFADLGITSVDLTADATNIELPDGSTITGQTVFTWADGSTGTVADVTLIAEADGYRLEQVVSVDGAGTRTEVTTAYAADGSIAFVNTTDVSSDGTQIANSYDDNGDGVVDRLQTIDTVTNPDGSTVKTVTNSLGATVATAILLNQTVTTTSADGNTITIDRDSTGGGWFDQTEVRTTAVDGSMTIVTTDKGQDGTVIRTVDESVSADGLTRTEAIDSDGDGLTDVTLTHVIVVNPDGSRSETITTLNQDGSTRAVVTETVSADGQTKTIARDVDGDGDSDTIEDLDIVTGPTGSTSTIVVTNEDGSTRSTTTQVQSEDALTKTIASDLDGDGDIDVTTVDQTVINPDGSRVQTITSTNTDGSVRSMQETTLGADKVTSQTHVDLNQNGVFETTDLVRDVSVDGTTGDRTATSWDRNADGSINAVTTSVTSADGLTRTTTIDADGDSDADGDGVVDTPASFDTQIVDATVIGGSGEAVRTITTINQDGSLRSETTATTSADGLTTTTTFDSDGDGAVDGTTQVSQTNNVDGTVVSDSSTYAGDGVTLLSQSVSTQSADRRIVTTDTDANGDGNVDRTTVSTQGVDGAQSVVETNLHADGTVAGTQTTTVSANGLVRTTATDADGDGVTETLTTSTTTLDADGGRTQVNETRNNDGSLRSESIVTTSDDGLTTVTQTDGDGDGTAERTNTGTTTLNADGSQTTVAQLTAEDGSLISQSLSETSDDGLVTTQSTDADGNGTYDLISTTTTTLEVDGGTTTVNEVRDAAGVLRSGSTTTASDDGRHATRSVDVNGDGVADQTSVTIEADDGTLTSTTAQLAADGSLQSASETVINANGLNTTVSQDRDGDGIDDLVMLEATALNADGSTTQVTEDRGRDGTTYSRATVTTSDDGRTTTRSNDYDADGTADLTVVSVTDIAADGVQTQTTTRSAANGATIGELTVETSANGRTVTTNNDTDGNGHDDLRSTSTVADNGARKTTTEYLSTGGTVESTYEVITSGDGRTTTRLTDRNGDGEIDLRTVETSAVGVDGTVTQSVEHRGHYHVLEGREEHSVSDDGMSSSSALDLDGDGVFDFITETETTYAANGDVTQSQVTRDITSDTLSEITTITSGDGLHTDITADYSGDGSIDRTIDIDRGADGGFTSTTTQYGAGYDLQQVATQTVSADGRSSAQTLDIDGDGFVDQRVDATVDLSGATTTIYEDVQINGVVSTRVTATEAANGMSTSYAFDVDGDGTTDLTRTTDVSYNDNGDMVTSFSEIYGSGTLGYQESTTTSANGLVTITAFDVDGDDEIDGSAISVTTLHGSGARDTLTETLYADGELHSSVAEYVSADGRTTTREMDYDGNGIADKTSALEIAADGSSIETVTSFNVAGIHNNTFITTTSADGLTTTVMRQGNVQTTTRSVLDNGSYDWDNGVTGSGHRSTSLEIDALGVETWSLTQTTGTVTEQFEVRLDATAKDRLFEEAASIYDTVLDRGLDSGESEALIQWVDDGQLDKVALIADLMGSGEHATRYGTQSDAEFVTQTYMNAFGRSPSMVELAQNLSVLDAGLSTRAELTLEINDSVEHSVVGNGHMLTNNFDVIMNPAVFERSLDKAYVESVITNIVDVVYDRDPTEQELTYLSELLLEGDKQPDDIAAILMGVEGDLHGVSTTTLHGLSGEALVQQAFLNALGRDATPDELSVWSGHLSAANLSTAQFVASLAQSAEHLEHGNAHEGGSVPQVTIVTTSNGFGHNGTSGQDHIIGGSQADLISAGAGSDLIEGGLGNDVLAGAGGSDTYRWATGDGNDTISDLSANLTETDTLHLTNVLSTDVSLWRDNTSDSDVRDDVVITIISTGETITILDQRDVDDGKGIEQIIFADDEVWDDQRILYEIVGSGGNVSPKGGTGDDYILGRAVADDIYAKSGDDIIEGLGGNDTLRGESGSDTYIWSRGDGADVIDEEDDGTPNLDYFRTDIDRLVLKNVNSDEVTLTRGEGAADLKNDLHIHITGDTVINVWDQFDVAGEGIEQIVFADGVTWNLQDIIDQTWMNGTSGNNTIDGLSSSDDNIRGGAGNDTLHGHGGNDTLVGEVGDDILRGHAGDDRYVWSKGDGDDILHDNASLTDFDTLELTDVSSNEVRLHRPNGSVHLYVEIIYGATTETIRLHDQFNSSYLGSGVEAIEFADGVTWTTLDLLSRAEVNGSAAGETLTGTSFRDNLFGRVGNDTLHGHAGNDWLYGGADNDTLYGGAGHDTYVYEKDDGNDLIIDTGAATEVDTLQLVDIASDNADLTKVGDDLIVTITSTGETITVRDRFDAGTTGSGDGIEFITFDDDVTVEVLGGALAETITTGTEAANTLNGWGLEDTLIGEGGNDTLYGHGGDDTLIGGSDADILFGGAGNDTYVWSTGSGNDVINDWAPSTTEIDRLELSDVSSEDVTLIRTGADNRHTSITMNSTGETITVDAQFDSRGHGYGIEEIEFADGIVWSLDEIFEHTSYSGTGTGNSLNGTLYLDNLYGLEGNDTLSGHAGDDQLIGGVGNDKLYGGDGNDTYVWSDGDGSDIIIENANDETDTLSFEDRTSDTVSLKRLSGSNDLYVVIETGQQNDQSTAGAFLYEYHNGNPGAARNVSHAYAEGSGVTYSTRPADMKKPHSGDYDKYGLRLASIVEVTTAGYYTFTTGSDDGSILWIDGEEIVDNDGRHNYRERSGSVYLEQGQHTILVNYYEYKDSSTLHIFVEGADTSDQRVNILQSGMLGVAADAAHLLDQSNFTNVDQRYDLIEVRNQFQADNDGTGIESIVFADGETWTHDDIVENTATTGDVSSNRLFGSNSGDNMFGLEGDDLLDGNGGDDHLYGGDGNDELIGDAGNDSLHGGNGDDELIGGDGADLLYGGAGDDLLRGDGGANYFDGGDGTDTVDFSGMAGEVVVDLTTGQIDWPSNGTIETIVNVENVIGTSGDDIIIGSDADNHLDGGSGDNEIYGMDGDDTIVGGAGSEVLSGGDGDDHIGGGLGTDTHDGGAGVDTLDVSHSPTNATVDLAAGFVNWTWSGGSLMEVATNFENVVAGAGANIITGTNTANDIQAGGGNDTITGGAGNDILTGGAGADTFVFNLGDGQDQITDFEDGIDTLDFSSSGLSFADLTITTTGTSTFIDYDNGQQIELLNVTGSIDQNDFVFV